jgi:hypothetical protein
MKPYMIGQHSTCISIRLTFSLLPYPPAFPSFSLALWPSSSVSIPLYLDLSVSLFLLEFTGGAEPQREQGGWDVSVLCRAGLRRVEQQIPGPVAHIPRVEGRRLAWVQSEERNRR